MRGRRAVRLTARTAFVYHARVINAHVYTMSVDNMS